MRCVSNRLDRSSERSPEQVTRWLTRRVSRESATKHGASAEETVAGGSSADHDDSHDSRELFVPADLLSRDRALFLYLNP
jgi:hypothetical protein